MWEDRAKRFPEHTPNTREYYLLRSIFEKQFPSKQAMATVPKVETPYMLLGLSQVAVGPIPRKFSIEPPMP